jgi:hypothetical protein
MSIVNWRRTIKSKEGWHIIDLNEELWRKKILQVNKKSQKHIVNFICLTPTERAMFQKSENRGKDTVKITNGGRNKKYAGPSIEGGCHRPQFSPNAESITAECRRKKWDGIHSSHLTDKTTNELEIQLFSSLDMIHNATKNGSEPKSSLPVIGFG